MKFIINYSYNLPYENKQDGGDGNQENVGLETRSLDLQLSSANNSKQESVSIANENIKLKTVPETAELKVFCVFVTIIFFFKTASCIFLLIPVDP